TGHPPFRADTAMAVLRRGCDDTPRPNPEINPQIPQGLAGPGARPPGQGPPPRLPAPAGGAPPPRRRGDAVPAGAPGRRPPVGARGAAAAGCVGRGGGRGRRRLPVGRLSAVVAVVGVVLAGWLTRGWWLPASSMPTTAPTPVAPSEPWNPRPPLTADELANLP